MASLGRKEGQGQVVQQDQKATMGPLGYQERQAQLAIVAPLEHRVPQDCRVQPEILDLLVAQETRGQLVFQEEQDRLDQMAL